MLVNNRSSAFFFIFVVFIGESQKKIIMRRNFNKEKFIGSIARYGRMLTEGEAMYDDYDKGYEQMAKMRPQRMPEDDEMYGPEEGGMYAEEENMDLSKQDDKIAQIREIALSGLQEYSEDVDSPLYQFYKKVWLMCDKAVSEKEENEAGEGKK